MPRLALSGRREPGQPGSRRPATSVAALVMIMISGLLAAQACSLGPGGDSGSARGQVPPPTFDVGSDGSPLAGWQAETAAAVNRVLTQQAKGVVIAETATGEPRIAEALRAAAALRQLGWRTTVKLGVDLPEGLVRDEGQDPLLLTRLEAIAKGETTATARSEVRKRLIQLRPELLRHEPAAVTATLAGLDILELGGDLRPTDLPAEKLCPTAGEDRAIVATGLLSLAGRAGLACAGAESWTERARQAVLETDPITPQGQEIALTAGRFLAESGEQVEIPGTCLNLLRSQSTYRALIPAIAYQTCAELLDLAGGTVEVNPRAANDLELLAETGGRIDDALQIDAVGLHYSVLVLRLLGFRTEHLDAVRETPVASQTALDQLRVVLATADAADLPAQLSGPHPVATPDDSYAAAMAVNAGGTCPVDWPAQPSWRTDTSGRVDSFELLRHATIVAAQATCSNRDIAAAERRRIAEAAEALERETSQSTSGPAALTDLWKANESTCLVGVEPELTDTVLTRLPDYADLSRTELDLGRLFSAVRLSDLARHGCGPTRWPLAGG